MISSLRPQMFFFPPQYYWMPSFGSYIPDLGKIPNEQKHEEPTNIFNKSQEGENEDASKEPKRRTWTVEEDQKLLQVIQQMNFQDGKRLPYHKIAKQFKGRTSKQIRQRYLNHLSKSINKQPFSKLQDQDILRHYVENGPKWKRLSLIMKGRTPTSLKNRFNTKLKQALTTRPSISQTTPPFSKQFQSTYISQESS